jgi:hypothetical protein
MIIAVLEGYNKMAAHDKSDPSNNSVQLNQESYEEEAALWQAKCQGQ